MNAKYYPALRRHAALAEEVLAIPAAKAAINAAKLPGDAVAAIYEALVTLGIDSKDDAAEVAKMAFYGYYVEVNEYYRKNS